jgi:hypothetical protein
MRTAASTAAVTQRRPPGGAACTRVRRRCRPGRPSRCWRWSGMLGPMDSSAAAIGPLVVLGVAAVGLLVIAVVAVVLLRPALRPAEPGAGRRGPLPAFPDDDLPSFRARPPGFPGAPSPRTMSSAPVALAPTLPPARPSSRRDALPVAPFLLALSAFALLLVAGAAAVALPSARAERTSPAIPPASEPPGIVPVLPPVPDSPTAGQGGAGELAYVSLPLRRGDVATTLAFGGVVMDQHAVGVTATYPALSLTTHGTEGLVHLRLPTWNCFSPDAPADPTTAGCVSSVTEYADLPTPALRMTDYGNNLVVQGRFPTYTRPNGSAPEYTGKVYDVTVTVTPSRRLASGRQVAEAVLTLGSGTARTTGDPLVDVLERGR